MSAVVTLDCARQASCTPVAAYLQAQCPTMLLQELGLSDAPSEVDAGLLAYDAALAQSCVQQLTTLGCGSSFAAITSCVNALSPNVTSGGGCARNGECQNGYCAVGSVCPGVCTDYVESFYTCEGPGQCDPKLDLVCGPESENMSALVCVGETDIGALAELGGPCGPNADTLADCGYGLYCAIPASDAGLPGVCVVQSADGGSCDPSAVTCGPGLACTGVATGDAGPFCLPASDVGGPCSSSTPALGESGCLSGLACVPPLPDAGIDAGPFCAVPPSEGDCTSDPNARCEPLAHYCDPSTVAFFSSLQNPPPPKPVLQPTCQLLGAGGAQCQSSLSGRDCLSGACDPTGHCVRVCAIP